MLIKLFNKAWEKERKRIEERLSAQFEHEIKCINFGIDNEEKDSDYRLELQRMRAALQLRKSLAAFESEEIVHRRMQQRTAYLALFTTVLALLVSIMVFLLKGWF